MATHENQVRLDGSLSGAQGTQLADASTNSENDSTLDRIRMRAYELYSSAALLRTTLWKTGCGGARIPALA